MKELLALPFMESQVGVAASDGHTALRSGEGVLWRNRYAALANASVQEKQSLKQIQEDALEVNADEANIETVDRPTRRVRGKQMLVACFASEGLL